MLAIAFVVERMTRSSVDGSKRWWCSQEQEKESGEEGQKERKKERFGDGLPLPGKEKPSSRATNVNTELSRTVIPAMSKQNQIFRVHEAFTLALKS